MCGIHRQAVANKLPVLGTLYTVADIANTNSICAWNSDMYGVDMRKTCAQAYYNLMLASFASWCLDYVKVDILCSPYHKDEIETIRKWFDHPSRLIVFFNFTRRDACQSG